MSGGETRRNGFDGLYQIPNRYASLLISSYKSNLRLSSTVVTSCKSTPTQILTPFEFEFSMWLPASTPSS